MSSDPQTSPMLAPATSTVVATTTDAEESGRGVRLRNVPLGKLREHSILLAVLVVVSAYFAIESPYFLTYDNWLNILQAASVAGIVACAGTFVMVAGQVDLSVGSGVLFTGVVMSWFAQRYGVAAGVGMAACAGLVLGCVNSFAVAFLGVNAIITTLGTLAAFQGLGDLITNGQATTVSNFGGLGNARPFFNIPVPVLLFVVLAIATWAVMRFTVFGRSVYAVGSNPIAARLSGIRARRIIFAVFLLSGLCVALSGLILDSQLGSTSPSAGVNLELTVVTAVILGGASFTGGRGTIVGTVLGLLILGVLDNGLVLLNTNTYWQNVITGALLITAVAFDQLRQRRRGI